MSSNRLSRYFAELEAEKRENHAVAVQPDNVLPDAGHAEDGGFRSPALRRWDQRRPVDLGRPASVGLLVLFVGGVVCLAGLAAGGVVGKVATVIGGGMMAGGGLRAVWEAEQRVQARERQGRRDDGMAAGL